jgi:hypothetical protein
MAALFPNNVMAELYPSPNHSSSSHHPQPLEVHRVYIFLADNELATSNMKVITFDVTVKQFS